MYKVPRERKRERKKKTFRKLCAFQTTFNALRVTRGASLEKEEEYRAGKRYCVDDSLPKRIERSEKEERFPTPVERRGCWVSIDFFVEKSIQSWQKKSKPRTLKKERRIKEDKKHRQKLL